MTEINVNKELCNGCGLCSTHCPYGIIELDPNAKLASANPALVAYCSHCGHCSAICPEGAIQVEYEGAGPVPSLNGESFPTAGQLSTLMVMRRSVRKYRSEKVPQEILGQILDIVRYAPTGMNGQSVHWLVIEDPEEVKRLVAGVIDWSRGMVKTQPNHPLAPIMPMIIAAWEQGSDYVCHGAPHLIFAYAHKDNPVGFIDATIALTHLDLLAPVYGLGTCWAGIVQIALSDSPELMAGLGLPKDHRAMYGMMIGYPKYQFKRIPKRNALDIIWK